MTRKGPPTRSQPRCLESADPRSAGSDPLLIVDANLSGVTTSAQMLGLRWFKQKNCSPRLGPRPMLNSAMHDEQLARIECDLSIAQFKHQTPLKA